MSDLITFKENNVRNTISYFANLPKRMRAGCRNALEASGEMMRIYTVDKILKSPKGYKRYYHPTVGRTFSSYPGAYPANQSGDLAKSIKFIVLSPLQMLFGSDIVYAKWLEDGTKKMDARPFLLPSIMDLEFHTMQNLRCYTRAEM